MAELDKWMPTEVVTALIAAGAALVGALAGSLAATRTERLRLELDRRRRNYERKLEAATAFNSAAIRWADALLASVLPGVVPGSEEFEKKRREALVLQDQRRAAFASLVLISSDELVQWVMTDYVHEESMLSTAYFDAWARGSELTEELSSQTSSYLQVMTKITMRLRAELQAKW